MQQDDQHEQDLPRVKQVAQRQLLLFELRFDVQTLDGERAEVALRLPEGAVMGCEGGMRLTGDQLEEANAAR